MVPTDDGCVPACITESDESPQSGDVESSCAIFSEICSKLQVLVLTTAPVTPRAIIATVNAVGLPSNPGVRGALKELLLRVLVKQTVTPGVSGFLTELMSVAPYNGKFARCLNRTLARAPVLRHSTCTMAALRIIDTDHTSPDLTLGSLACRVGVSPFHLAHVLKADTGFTFRQLVAARRLEKARTLLETSTLRIKEIADQVGYHTVASFVSNFRRHIGSTPGRYRMNRLSQQFETNSN